MSPRRPFVRVAGAMSIVILPLTGSPGPAFATPPPPNPSDGELAEGRTAVQTAAEQVGVLASRVAAAGAALDAAQLELATKYDNVTVAQRQQKVTRETADAAQAAAESARVEVEAVGAHIQRAQRQVDKFAAASYRQGSAIGSISAYLGAESPKDLLARAELLNAVGGAELDALDTMSRALVDKANLSSAARAAFAEARTRQQQAEEAEAAATAAYETAVAAEAAAQNRAAELLSDQDELEQQLADARRSLAGLQGQRNTFDNWEDAQQATRQAPSQPTQDGESAALTPSPATSGTGQGPGRALAPTTGTITSTYGPRWGSIHYGLDIANSIGTPIVSVLDGRVISSGPASGFGLWVRVRHDNGVVTVYGHINETLVTVGQRVDVGQRIATVGSRGQSTGPHLHFEVHKGGRKIDPLLWLRSNGVSI
ncbi:Murein DD-endopeptidase MepM and murein hydrolase activator NlpD, contain LysM domain [Amycolatopsis marina]|uniref:Murein DD-endopeptidase MepM and murein hydrolase activator NlpD, contain LysM domain n=1 Tax=Amycolatopsis marina TaxID=490629 RepID=A0A1I1C1K1_9PSEU|nr:Murein DD-endopeptidase MepM and murein hydrolase activator NlpD, contain LysM domain [Amycolatopsis marina]